MSPIRPSERERYPSDWKLRSRFVRVVRSRGRCEWCGAANGQPHPVTGAMVVLTTAHVFDDRPEAAALLNLAALCQRCHNGHDAPRRRQGIQERRRARIEETQIPMVEAGEKEEEA
jgi:5-methylcytosine-specific restriction endonuclease McrA